MKPKHITDKRINAAYTIAICADIIQFPLSAASATVLLTVPAETVDFAIDCIVMVVLSRLLGFHWLLIPSMLGESIPGVDMLPTWTASVALLAKIRRDEQGGASDSNKPHNGGGGPSTPPSSGSSTLPFPA